MNKAEVIARYDEVVKELGLGANEVLLSAGAALVILGVRESTTDLDIDIPEGVFKSIALTYPVLNEENINPRIAWRDDVDLHITDEDVGRVCVEGVCMHSPGALLLQKRWLSTLPTRPPEKAVKDREDIAALLALMKTKTHCPFGLTFICSGIRVMDFPVIDDQLQQICSEMILSALNKVCNEFDIPHDQLCLGGSAAFVLMAWRDMANDINVWIDSPYFEKIVLSQGGYMHPMVDTMVKLERLEESGFNIYIRKRNRYHNASSLVFGHGIHVFDELALLVQKRGGHQDHRRPKEKKARDFEDIKILNEVISLRNKVG